MRKISVLFLLAGFCGGYANAEILGSVNQNNSQACMLAEAKGCLECQKRWGCKRNAVVRAVGMTNDDIGNTNKSDRANN